MDEFHRPPYMDEVYHGIKLYQWLIQQKNRCNEGKLKREYVDKFTEIGIKISDFTSAKELPKPAWMSTYMEYKKQCTGSRLQRKRSFIAGRLRCANVTKAEI